jgi:ribA/ribD-fused uncharacterized protein
MIVRRVVREFRGDYLFLSNFWPWEGARELGPIAPVTYNGFTFPSSEHAYQTAKFYGTHDEALQDVFTRMTKYSGKKNPAAQAKAWAREATRSDYAFLREWEKRKDEVMYEVVVRKFQQNTDLRRRLLGTGDALLEEGNWWGDRYWGVSPARSGRGLNRLGVILMQVRLELSSMEGGHER